MDLLAFLLGDLWKAPRFVLPLLLGIGAGLGLFFLTGREPASAAMALGCALLGSSSASSWNTCTMRRAIRRSERYSSSKRSNPISSVSNSVSATAASIGEVR
jgi:hypothetical protein